MNIKKYYQYVFVTCLLFISVYSHKCFGQDKKMKLAVFDLIPSGKINTDLAALSEVMIAEIDKLGKFEIISKSEIKAMVGLEQEKQLLGCEDDTSCLAEIGGALGVERLVTGTVGKLGMTIIVSMKFINTKTVTIEGRIYESFKGDESLLVDAIKRLVPRLFGISIKEKGLGTLIIESKIKDGRVYLDGNRLGKLPIKSMKLKAGKYNISVTKEGYKKWKKKIEVIEKDVTEVLVKMKKISTGKVAKLAKKKTIKALDSTTFPKKQKAKKITTKTPWYKSWWVWTLGAGIVAGSTAAIMATQGSSESSNPAGGREIYINMPPQPND